RRRPRARRRRGAAPSRPAGREGSPRPRRRARRSRRGTHRSSSRRRPRRSPAGTSRAGTGSGSPPRAQPRPAGPTRDGGWPRSACLYWRGPMPRLIVRRSLTAVGIYSSVVFGFLGTVVATREFDSPRLFGDYATVLFATALLGALFDLTVEEALVKYG